MTEQTSKNELHRNFDETNNIYVILRYLSQNVSYLMKSADKIIKRIDLNKYLDKISQRPWLAGALIILTSITVVSVATFVVLLMITTVIALTGVVLIEGTIITVGTVILCGCILSIWILAGVFAVIGACFYYGTLYFHNHFHTLQTKDLTNISSFEDIQKVLNENHEQHTEDNKKID